MKVAISGSTGFIGSSLKNKFLKKGWDVVSLTRSDFSLDEKSFLERLSGCDVIVNLAGSSIFKRWTKKNKTIILSSRLLCTAKIVKSIRLMPEKPKLFISASATGIYDEQGVHDEDNFSYASGFLAEVCKAWESEARLTSDTCRTVLMRLGVVLDKGQGAIGTMLPLFRLGLGGSVGSGKQGFPWIHIDDLVNAVFFIIGTESISGTVNMVAPENIDNKTFSKSLAKTINRPSFLPVPSFLLNLLFGESATVLTKGQIVYPAKLLNAGFRFDYPEINIAMMKIFSSEQTK